MIHDQSVLSSRPQPTTIPFRELSNNRDYEISSWGATTEARMETFAVDEPEVTIAVMGATGSGKTTFINQASGSHLRVGSGLRSCTSIVQMATPFEFEGRSVVLIDTPGFDDTTKSDTDILKMISAFLASAYENGKKLAGVIYIHRISDFRMGGVSTRNFNMFRRLCGESTLKNVVIVTNMWGEVSPEVGKVRETELMEQDIFFKPVLNKGARCLRHDNSQQSAHDILRYIISNNPLSLQIQRELVDQKKDISQTAAGEELNREMMLQIRKHQNDMRALQEEMKEAIRLKDEETRRELETETKKLQDEMNRVQEDAKKLSTSYTEEKERLERRMQEMSESARQEGERNAAAYASQMGNLERQLNDVSSRSAAERENLLHELEHLRRNPPRSRGFFGMIGSAIDAIFGIH